MKIPPIPLPPGRDFRTPRAVGAVGSTRLAPCIGDEPVVVIDGYGACTYAKGG